MPSQLEAFHTVWLVDFEFRALAGERPQPVCLVAREFSSGQEVRLWADQLGPHSTPPYPLDDTSLCVAYYASAELGCHLALGWPMPARILDLYAEFRCHTAGLTVPHGHGLLGALSWYGLDVMDAIEKKAMRELIMRGGPWSTEEKQAVLNYCAEDVHALARLLPKMWSKIDLPRALLRGRYTAAVARMEHTGVPIDTAVYGRLRANWESLRGRLIEVVNAEYMLDAEHSVFEGRTFKANRWADWVTSRGIIWPKLPSGNLALDDDTFKQMARVYPAGLSQPFVNGRSVEPAAVSW
jgi:hypothetical protein